MWKKKRTVRTRLAADMQRMDWDDTLAGRANTDLTNDCSVEYGDEFEGFLRGAGDCNVFVYIFSFPSLSLSLSSLR